MNLIFTHSEVQISVCRFWGKIEEKNIWNEQECAVNCKPSPPADMHTVSIHKQTALHFVFVTSAVRSCC